MPVVLTVLGSGCFAPAAEDLGKAVRNPAGYALELGDQVLLFDLGFGNLRQLVRAGIDPARVTHAFFSHRHPDHVGDLPALLFHLRAAKPASGKLSLFGPRGFSAFLGRLRKAHHPWTGPRGFELSTQDLEEGSSVKGRGWKLAAREVPHSTEALAFRLEAAKVSLCYSGDTGLDPGLAAFARGASLFVIECTLGDDERHAGHLRVSEALGLLSASGAKAGLFSHLSSASARELAARLPKNAKIASDLLTLRLG